MSDDVTFDVVVIGGGAAGLSAAVTLGRARRRVVVVDAGEPRNAPAGHVHGLLGQEGTPPRELLATGRAEAAAYGVELLDGRVEKLARHDDENGDGYRYDVRLRDGTALAARRVVVTTGLKDVLPDVPGVAERFGTDVLHCPYCHGWEVRDTALGVLGTQPHSVLQALLIRQWSADVVFFPNGFEVTDEDAEKLAARGVRVEAGPVERIVVEDGRLTGVELADGRVVPRTAVFAAPQFVPRDDLLFDLGCERDETGWVRTDATGRTSEPGVWAAGNVTDMRAQVIVAAGRGATAAYAVDHDLFAEDVDRAVAERRRAAVGA